MVTVAMATASLLCACSSHLLVFCLRPSERSISAWGRRGKGLCHLSEKAVCARPAGKHRSAFFGHTGWGRLSEEDALVWGKRWKCKGNGRMKEMSDLRVRGS